MPVSPRLKIPLLSTGQAQKELTHNEALILLDMLVQPSVFEPSDSPPVTSISGALYLCGPSPSGAWSGKAHALAMATEAGWRFIAPFEGQRITMLATGQERVFLNGAWSVGVVRATELRVAGKKVVSAQQPAIAPVAGGTVVDIEARQALKALIEALQAHGLIAQTVS